MKKEPQYLNYLKIEKQIIALDVSACARIVLAYIHGYYKKPDTKFNCSNSFISQELNFSLDQVKRAIKELDEKSLIVIEYIKPGYGRSNRIIYSKLHLDAQKAIAYFNKNYGIHK